MDLIKTNYDRYFSDLGTFWEVIEAVDQICASVSPYDCIKGYCVFESWCGDTGIAIFPFWLRKPAESL